MTAKEWLDSLPTAWWQLNRTLEQKLLAAYEAGLAAESPPPSDPAWD